MRGLLPARAFFISILLVSGAGMAKKDCPQKLGLFGRMKPLKAEERNKHYFEEHQNRRQPKADVSRAVVGVNQAHLYKNPAEAIGALMEGQVKSVIFRSEWSHEFDGPSGLFESHSVSQNDIENFARKNNLNPKLKRHHKKIAQQLLAQYKTQDVEKLEQAISKLDKLFGKDHARRLDLKSAQKHLSYSAWEKIEGENISMFQDSANPNLIHITHQSGVYTDHYVYDRQGTFIKKFAFNRQNAQKDENKVKPHLEAAVEMYFKVKNQDVFDPQHAPIIEAQISESGKAYFLQYHKARQITEAEHTLKTPPNNNYKEVRWVRGMTPPEGTYFEVPFYSGSSAEFSFQGPLLAQKPVNERLQYGIESSATPMGKLTNYEHNLKIKLENNTHSVFLDLTNAGHINQASHAGITRLAKTQLAMSLPKEALMSKAHATALLNEAIAQGKAPVLEFHVLSDGKRAYIHYFSNNLGVPTWKNNRPSLETRSP